MVAGNRGKAFRKALKAYAASPRSVDALVFNDVLRHAGKHALLDQPAVERWLAYRANRNNTAHDYGEGFANETLCPVAGLPRRPAGAGRQAQDCFDAAQ